MQADMAHPNKEVLVACAVISDESGRYLVAKRPQGKALAGKWEFPGGKVEGTETGPEALRREIREEMGADIEVLNPLDEVVHLNQSGCIRLLPFSARLKAGTLRALEHDELRWASLRDLASLDLADADVPIVRQLSSVNCAAT